MIRSALIAIAVLTTSAIATDPDPRPLHQQPYIGLSVRDTMHGVVVGWIYPGPLGGNSFDSKSGIKRGDNLIAINDHTVESADDFRTTIDQINPATTITLTLRRSPDAQSNASVPIGGEGGDEYTVEVELGNRDEWTGTIGRGSEDRTFPDSPKGAFEDQIIDLAREHGILDHDTGLAKLMAHLRTVQDDALDPNSMPHIVRAFRDPLALDTIADDLINALAPIRDDRSQSTWLRIETIRTQIKPMLDRKPLNPNPGMSIREHEGAPSLMRTMRDNWSIDPDQAQEQITLIGSTVGSGLNEHFDVQFNSIIYLAKQLHSFYQAAADNETTETDSVQGKVLRDWTDPSPVRFVIGGPGDNVYDMSRIHAVLDPGGNDTYIWDHSFRDTSRARQVIIDLDGDDTYESTADFAGPGVGVYGACLIDDHAGNDTYTSSRMGSIAMGLFGVGIILDRAGDDTYDNTGPDSGWSIGAGFYGVGLVIDQSGRDTYRAEKLSQGVGGPRGIGAILDQAGNDLYQANGPNFPSAYGTPGVFLGMSQGFGFGIRGYAAGGIGLIDDASGNDQYIAGEFSQGGGYYFGLGMIRDHAGNDLYHGNRYGQAFAAHQAIGILIDDQGDDTYWSMTAASQSGVWDESITLLWDKQGNDAYRADGLAQGAAAMQALAIFIDSEGTDRYSVNPGAVLGQSSNDTYHFDTARVHSFSCFMDLGSSDDIYPGALRTNNSTIITGKPNDADLANATLHGLFIDQ